MPDSRRPGRFGRPGRCRCFRRRRDDTWSDHRNRDRDRAKDEIRSGILDRSDGRRLRCGHLDDRRRGRRRLDRCRCWGDRSRRRRRRRLRLGRGCGCLLHRGGRLHDDRRRSLDHRRGRRRSGRRRRWRRRRELDQCGRRCDDRRRRGRSRWWRERRQEAERIEVTLRLGGRADAEMEIRLIEVGRTARADGAESGALGHGVVLLHRVRAEMRQRHRQPVGGLDRHRLAARRHRPRVADNTARRRKHGYARCRGADVDAAVLPARVRMRGIEREALEYRAGDRPRPGVRAGNRQDEEEDERNEPPHGAPPLLSDLKTNRAR